MTGAVGIFWFVDHTLVAAGCTLEDAVQYGDCLTYDGGHADHWARWQEAGGYWISRNGLPLDILTTEYDDHSRGRIVKEPDSFVIYADRRLQTPKYLNAVCARFRLIRSQTLIRSDDHYRNRAKAT
ncbi:hypothetical protein [Parasphingorhabdus sp.]|uniref:hypothetical protein n=1 Tax=Parasphingorhabdus sp. TaxID=2709688 RepID=UPI002F933238